MVNKVERQAGEASGERKRKKTLGRRKIEIKPIQCPEAKHVCFSKRRTGLFKKASELCVLSGAHLAIVVFSPAGKPYTFGHPSVNAVVDRFLHRAAAAGEVARPADMYDFESESERLGKAIEAEAERRAALDAALRKAGVWTDDDVRRAGMPDLVAMLAALERVQAEAAHRAHEIFAEEAMMQQCVAAAASDGFHYLGDGGTFAADGDGSSSHPGATDMQVMLMGGNISQADHEPVPFAPAMQPPRLPPPPPQLPFNYGSGHNHIAVAGYASYGYNIGDGSSGHVVAYEMEGYYGTTTTCNFFG
ncbi:hypothetical protein BS78_04G047400 [Paspalum vaginatum]|nr:hypothetical protein BS78_04G047400 [Paspalum vaginatum]